MSGTAVTEPALTDRTTDQTQPLSGEAPLNQNASTDNRYCQRKYWRFYRHPPDNDKSAVQDPISLNSPGDHQTKVKSSWWQQRHRNRCGRVNQGEATATEMAQEDMASPVNPDPWKRCQNWQQFRHKMCSAQKELYLFAEFDFV